MNTHVSVARSVVVVVNVARHDDERKNYSRRPYREATAVIKVVYACSTLYRPRLHPFCFPSARYRFSTRRYNYTLSPSSCIRSTNLHLGPPYFTNHIFVMYWHNYVTCVYMYLFFLFFSLRNVIPLRTYRLIYYYPIPGNERYIKGGLAFCLSLPQMSQYIKSDYIKNNDFLFF